MLGQIGLLILLELGATHKPASGRCSWELSKTVLISFEESLNAFDRALFSGRRELARHIEEAQSVDWAAKKITGSELRQASSDMSQNPEIGKLYLQLRDASLNLSNSLKPTIEQMQGAQSLVDGLVIAAESYRTILENRKSCTRPLIEPLRQAIYKVEDSMREARREVERLVVKGGRLRALIQKEIKKADSGESLGLGTQIMQLSKERQMALNRERLDRVRGAVRMGDKVGLNSALLLIDLEPSRILIETDESSGTTEDLLTFATSRNPNIASALREHERLIKLSREP